ncbi:hypothetical protein [Sandaracinus amylolyticus]|nr:hypothetical protein [Sandaracinus amylolyticus]
MDDVLGVAREWGSWAGVVMGVLALLRSYASTSQRTIRQLATWLDEARGEITALRGELAAAKGQIARLAGEVERLTPFEARAQSLARELRETHAAISAGGGAEQRAISLVREPSPGIGAEVIEMPRAALREER